MILLLGLGVCCAAQTVSVYSEFAAISPAGEVTAPETPREILSPMLVRNGFTSFQVVVQAPAGKPWTLHIGQNPENAVRVAMYRENGNSLDPVTLPAESDGTKVFWMDLWTAGNASVQRIKVEPELNIDADWVVYPIEARVVDAVVPEIPSLARGLAPREAMRGLLCGVKAQAQVAGESPTTASLRARNAGQDIALASKHPLEELKRMFGSCDAAAPQDPEWYLTIRDYLFRLR